MSRVAANNEPDRHARAHPARSLRPDEGGPVPNSDMDPLRGLRDLSSWVPNSDGLLAMQHTAGNRAAAALVASRQAETKAAPKEKRPMPRLVALITFERAGKVTGESDVEGHEGEVELMSINLSAVSSRGKARDVTVVKATDRATSVFLNAAANGDTIKAAVFSFVRADAIGEAEVYHSLELSNGLVSSFTMIGDDRESIGLSFEPE